MSPALFTLVFDALSMLLAQAEQDGRLHGVKISRESPSISHFMYADDLVIFSRADDKDAKTVFECVNQFTSWSGLAFKYGKSIILQYRRQREPIL